MELFVCVFLLFITFIFFYLIFLFLFQGFCSFKKIVYFFFSSFVVNFLSIFHR